MARAVMCDSEGHAEAMVMVTFLSDGTTIALCPDHWLQFCGVMVADAMADDTPSEAPATLELADVALDELTGLHAPPPEPVKAAKPKKARGQVDDAEQ
jgi:hypothetical protein